MRLTGQPLQGCPALVRVVPAVASPQRCYLAHTAAGPIPALTPAALTLITVDAWGNCLVRGGAAVSAKLISPGASDTLVEDYDDGSYGISWVATLTGQSRMSVLVSGTHVQGSPFALRVVPAAGSTPGAGPWSRSPPVAVASSSCSPNSSPRAAGSPRPRAAWR